MSDVVIAIDLSCEPNRFISVDVHFLGYINDLCNFLTAGWRFFNRLPDLAALARVHDVGIQCFQVVPPLFPRSGPVARALVRRLFGGTPGKRLLKIRIVRVDGSPVGYREAVIRHVVQAVMGIGSAVALIMARWEMTDAQFHSMTWAVHTEHIAANKPSWSRPLDVVSQVWLWSEFVVMLTNKKRRALHDFIAGTVVVKDVAIPNVVPLPDLV